MVYDNFKSIFPQYSNITTDWFPNGKDSIRIRLNTGEDYVFTYHSKIDWCFETVESFIKNMKKGGRMMNAGLYDNCYRTES